MFDRTLNAIAGIALLGLVIGCRSSPGPPTSTATATIPNVTTPASLTPAGLTPAGLTPASPTPSKPTPTPDIAATLVAIASPHVISSQTSPDGAWRADVLSYDCMSVAGDDYGYDLLRLVRLADGVTRTADSQLLNCHGLGAAGLAGEFWSANGRFFYYSTSRVGVPEGCGYFPGAISRLDVAGMRVKNFGEAEISSNHAYLGTWDVRTKEVILWDANSGDSMRVPARQDMEVGPMAWSPDGKAMVYLQNKSYCPSFGPSILVRLSLPDLAATMLLRSDAFFQAVRWDEPGQLRLMDGSGTYRSFDLASGTLEPAQ